MLTVDTIHQDLGFRILRCPEQLQARLTYYQSHPDLIFEVLNGRGRSPILFAISQRKPACIEAMLSSGIEITPDTLNHALVLTIELGLPDIVSILLRHGAEPNQEDLSGEPLLDHSMFRIDDDSSPETPYYRCFLLLLEAGADPNRKGMNYYSPLVTAIDQWLPRCVKGLIDHGAETTVQDGTNTLSVINYGRNHADYTCSEYSHGPITPEKYELVVGILNSVEWKIVLREMRDDLIRRGLVLDIFPIIENYLRFEIPDSYGSTEESSD